MPETYYRVLEDIPKDGQVNQQSTKRKWDRGEWVSTHKGYPPSWIDKWNAGSTTVADYTDADLECEDGRRTQAALDAFLAAAESLGVDEAALWPEEVQIAVGQIEDVFAYETPEEAWQYVLGGGDSITPEILGMNWIVEFTGEDTGHPIPEANKGGVQVRVLDAGVTQTAEEFANAHNFDIPLDNGEGEIPLEFPHEEDDPDKP